MISRWYILSFLWQSSFFVLLATFVNYAYDMESGLSTLLGGLAYCVPALLANLYIHQKGRLEKTLQVAYMGTIYRLVIGTGLLIFIFKEMDLRDGIVISCFCLGAVVQYVTSFVSINREK